MRRRTYSDRQRLFILYFVGALIDLVVLGLFDQYSDKVYVEAFTTMLLASVLLQFLLKATIAVEHRVASYFKGKAGGWWMASALLQRLARPVRIEVRDP